jgi:exonuclease III
VRHAGLMAEHRSLEYRQAIDAMVDDCLTGQGQTGPRRVRTGVWNTAAGDASIDMPDQTEMNRLLADLSTEQREVLSAMLAQEFVSGIHQALVAFHECGIEPFEDGYEGTPFHDFVGRLNGWRWPE